MAQLTKEQVIKDIELCKTKIKEALDYNVYSVLPLYVEIIGKLFIELNKFGLECTTIWKGVHQNTTIDSDIRVGDIVETDEARSRFTVSQIGRHGVALQTEIFHQLPSGSNYIANYKNMPFKKVTN